MLIINIKGSVLKVSEFIIYLPKTNDQGSIFRNQPLTIPPKYTSKKVMYNYTIQIQRDKYPLKKGLENYEFVCVFPLGLHT